MTSRGRVKLSKIRKMLRKCAPGFSEALKTHHRAFVWEGKAAFLPSGEHGVDNPEIEIGHLKKLIRLLDLDLDCVRRHLREIAHRLKKATPSS